jgi:hypothetical protein
LQEEALASMVKIARENVANDPCALLVVGSYHIGKERAYLGTAAAMRWKVWACPAKVRVNTFSFLVGGRGRGGERRYTHKAMEMQAWISQA